MKIGFIGLGNMAKAMIGGILRKNIISPEDILGYARTKETRDRVSKEYGITIGESNEQVAQQADILFLAVKPQMFGEVIPQIRDQVKAQTLIVSIAAGKTIAQIEEAFEKEISLIRCMPNTPAMVLEGCTGACRNSGVTDEEMETCMKLLLSFGLAYEVPERLMDAVGAVSGSSPAFVFQFIEAMADGGVKAGMPRSQALGFAAQTVLGSAKLLLESGKHPGELKDMVCSPGGTTICGVQALEEAGLRGAVMKAIEACVERSKNM